VIGWPSDEAYTRWMADYERVTGLRDAAAEALRGFYTVTERGLVDLFTRIGSIDADVQRVNAAKPDDRNNDGRLLRSVELEARDIDGFGLHGLSIIRDLKWPAWSHGQAMAWPRPQVPLALQMLAAQVRAAPEEETPPRPMDWHEQLVEQDRRVQKDAQRVADSYAKRERQREERQAAEARAANERERERRHERGIWW
jgi:hypothetical protein